MYLYSYPPIFIMYIKMYMYKVQNIIIYIIKNIMIRKYNNINVNHVYHYVIINNSILTILLSNTHYNLLNFFEFSVKK